MKKGVRSTFSQQATMFVSPLVLLFKYISPFLAG